MSTGKLTRRGALGPLPKFDLKTGNSYDWTGKNVSGSYMGDGDPPEVPIANLNAPAFAQMRIPFTVLGGPSGIRDGLSDEDKKWWDETQITEGGLLVNEDQPMLAGFPTRTDPETGDIVPIPPEQFLGGVLFIVQGYVIKTILKLYDLEFAPVEETEVPYENCPVGPVGQGPPCIEFIEGVTDPGPGFYMRNTGGEPTKLTERNPGDESKQQQDFLKSDGVFIALKVVAWYNPDDEKNPNGKDPTDIFESDFCWCLTVSEGGGTGLRENGKKKVGDTGAADKLYRDQIQKTYSKLPPVEMLSNKPDDDVLIAEILSFFRQADSELKGG